MRALRAPLAWGAVGTAYAGRALSSCPTRCASVGASWPALPPTAPAALRAALEDEERALCAFRVEPDCIRTLGGPVEFYDELLAGVAGAKRRILLASLYIGTGEKETALLEAVASACARRPALRATLLVDALRTQRVERPSGVSSLQRILETAGGCIAPAAEGGAAGESGEPEVEQGGGLEVFLYHTHLLGRLGKQLLPPRWNEGISLQHCKVYLFDDTVILSGANLSDTYFTDRDDRYVVFADCAPLADYVTRLFGGSEGLPALCYSVPAPEAGGANGAAEPGEAAALRPPAIGFDPVRESAGFGEAAEAHLAAFLATERARQLAEAQRAGEGAASGTWLVPSIQMAAHNIKQDEALLADVVRDLGSEADGSAAAAASADPAAGPGSRGELVLSSAYLNLTSSQWSRSPLAHALAACRASLTLVLASDESHGFSGASGLSAHIPRGYALLRSRLQGFLEDERKANGAETEVRLHRRLVDGKHWS